MNQPFMISDCGKKKFAVRKLAAVRLSKWD